MRVGGFMSYCNCFGPQPGSWVTAGGWNTRKQLEKISSTQWFWQIWPITKPLDQSYFKPHQPAFVCSWTSFSLSGLQNCISLEPPAPFRPQCQSVISSIQKWLLGWMPLAWPCRCSFSQHWFSNPIGFIVHLSRNRCSNHAGLLRLCI